jgi:hypothetical protein
MELWQVREKLAELERRHGELRDRVRDIDDHGTREVRVLKRDVEHLGRRQDEIEDALLERISGVADVARNTQRVVIGAAVTVSITTLTAALTVILATGGP